MDSPVSLENTEAKVGSLQRSRLTRSGFKKSTSIALASKSCLLVREFRVEALPSLTGAALKCDLREDPVTKDKLESRGMHPVSYEQGLATARAIRATRYLGGSSYRLTASRG